MGNEPSVPPTMPPLPRLWNWYDTHMVNGTYACPDLCGRPNLMKVSVRPCHIEKVMPCSSFSWNLSNQSPSPWHLWSRKIPSFKPSSLPDPKLTTTFMNGNRWPHHGQPNHINTAGTNSAAWHSLQLRRSTISVLCNYHSNSLFSCLYYSICPRPSLHKVLHQSKALVGWL